MHEITRKMLLEVARVLQPVDSSEGAWQRERNRGAEQFKTVFWLVVAVGLGLCLGQLG